MRFVHAAASRCGFFALSVIFLLVLVAPGWAQVSTGTILGVVKDSSGGLVADATVTITNTETAQVRTVTTNAEGAFNAPSLPVGHYTVKIEKTGFQSFTQQGIDLVVSQELVVSPVLNVGASNQQVVVTSEAPIVNTTTAQVSGLVGEQTVKELPLNGRSYDNLITLNTGAVNFTAIHPANTTQGGFGHLFSVSGRRPDANLFLLNGVQYGGTGLQTDLPGSVSQQLLGIDAIREFNVLSENYSAEYGKRTGGQILIVTNSGTNTIHGSVFDFERNSALDSRNAFDIQTRKIPHFTRHNFGASGGAPIRKDKTFIFANYEGLRQDLGLSNVAFVPDTALLTTGILPCTPGGDCPMSGSVTVSPSVLPYLKLYPAQNGPEVGGGLAEFLSSPSQAISEQFGTVRLDQIIGTKDTLSGVYTIDSGVSSTPDVTDTTITLFQLRTQVVSISDTHVFSSNLLNTATAGFSRANFSQSPSTSIPASFAFIQNYQMGTIVVGNGGGAGGSSTISKIGTTAASSDARNIYTLGDNVQVTKGIHQLTFGVLFQRVDDNENEIGAAGTASFNDLVGFVTGALGSFQGAPVFTPLSWRAYEGAWFVSDSIKVRRNLTVTLGLRHEFTNGWNEVYGRSSRYEFGTNDILQTVPKISSSAINTNNGILLFAPRVGVAWDPFGDGKTSVEAGFGLYYNVMDTLGQLSSVNAPFNGNEIITGGTFPFPLQTSTTTLAQPSPVEYDGNLKTPTLLAYNVKIQRQILPSLAVTVGFNGNHGTHNVSFEDENTVIPEVCSAAIPDCAAAITNAYAPTDPRVNPANGIVSLSTPLPNGTLFYPTCAAGVVVPLSTSLTVCPRRNPALGSSKLGESDADSWYNAGTIEIVQRARGGFTFKTNYTYSKATDDATSTLVFQGSTNNVLNVNNLASEWGPSQFDIRNRFSFSGTYELPFGKGKMFGGNAGDLANRAIGGWELNTIITVQSGSPFNPFLGFDQSRNGNTNQPDRPDINPLFTGNPYPHTVKQWYNPAQFALPPAGTYGNAGRNSLVGPPLREVDLSLSKSTLITERLSAQFRAEAFNIFNHWNLGVPNTTVLTTGGSPASTAGSITTTATTSRQLQFGLKLIW